MKMILAAIIISQCSSPSQELSGFNTTVYTACPGTVRYVYEEQAETLTEFRRIHYYRSLPRDDRQMVSATGIPPKPVAKPVQITKKQSKKKRRKR